VPHWENDKRIDGLSDSAYNWKAIGDADGRVVIDNVQPCKVHKLVHADPVRGELLIGERFLRNFAILIRLGVARSHHPFSASAWRRSPGLAGPRRSRLLIVSPIPDDQRARDALAC